MTAWAFGVPCRPAGVQGAEPALSLPRPYRYRLFDIDQPIDVSLAGLDAAMRDLLAAGEMPADLLQLAYDCEPSFLRALAVKGHRHALVFAPAAKTTADTPGGRESIVALGVHSVRSAWLNGRPADIGYLHDLRIHPERRGSSLLSRGYQAFREVSRLLRPAWMLTSILAENEPARRLLENTSGRGPLPAYQLVTPYLTALLPLRGPGARWPARGRYFGRSGVHVRALTAEDAPALLELCRDVGRVTDGFSFPDVGVLAGHADPLWPGLGPGSFRGAFRDGRLVAVVGLWDQTGFKQIRVTGLHPAVDVVRRAWAVLAPLVGPCPLPPVGQAVKHILLDPWAVRPGEERRALRVLLTDSLGRLRHESAASFAAFGVSARHPAAALCRHFFFLPYWSNIYAVAWPESPVPERSGDRLVHLPLGTL